MSSRRARRDRGNGRGQGRRNETINEEEEREATPPPPPPPPPPRQITQLFLQQKPPKFDGLGDPSTSETWIRELERIFDFLECTDQERHKCVTCQLVFWWEARRKIMTVDELAALTWEDFKNGIYDKYIPGSYQRGKEVEFNDLKQGRMTVTEYDRAFCDMSRYAPDQVGTDGKMAGKFRIGLKYEIRMALACLGRLSYIECLSRALDIEETMPKEKSIVPATPVTNVPPRQQNFREKRRWDGNRAPFETKRHQPFPNQQQNLGRQTTPNQEGGFQTRTPHCNKCSKFHFGECRNGGNRCFACGGNGHV